MQLRAYPDGKQCMLVVQRYLFRREQWHTMVDIAGRLAVFNGLSRKTCRFAKCVILACHNRHNR
jgi:hypothetical protein